MLALLSALTLLAALVVIVIVVAVRGDLAFLREVEHEAHHRNVEVIELNGDFLQIALHGHVTARCNASLRELGATDSALREMVSLCFSVLCCVLKNTDIYSLRFDSFYCRQ